MRLRPPRPISLAAADRPTAGRKHVSSSFAIACLASAFSLFACSSGESDDKVFTRYRNSVTDNMRIHVATFDAARKNTTAGTASRRKIYFRPS